MAARPSALAGRGGGDGATRACLLVLLYLSRTSTTSIRRHRVCAVVQAQHPTHGERWQPTQCTEGERTACVAVPGMCDAYPCACASWARHRTGSASRVFVTEPPQLDGRSQVAAAPIRRREGNDGLLAVGGGLASVVAAVLS